MASLPAGGDVDAIYWLRFLQGQRVSRSPRVGKEIGGGFDLLTDWVLKRKEGSIGSMTVPALKIVPVRLVAANSDALFPEAKATRKRVFNKRSLLEIWGKAKRGDEKLSSAASRDQLGFFLRAGGFFMKILRVSRPKLSWSKSILKAVFKGRARHPL